ncbi:MAG: hypothetical protein OHK0053_01320 [Microscillaceae bacterium]
MLEKLKIITLLCFLLAAFACDGDEEDIIGNWIELSDFEGIPRNNAVSFTINGFAYVGTGYSEEEDEYLRDFWRYDPVNNFWTQQADFPGVGRSGAVAFSAREKGYVGTGYDGDIRLSDFWAYDPDDNSWVAVASFPGSARRNAIAFGVYDKGFVGTGDDSNTLKDFWEYEPLTDSWRQVVSIPGSKRVGAFVMVIQNRVFVGGGLNNGQYQEDFYEFEPTNGELGTWIRKRDLDAEDDYNQDIQRAYGIGLGIGNKGYVMAGNRGAALSSTWEYDPVSDIWEQKTSFEGLARTEAVGFVMDEVGYIALGRNGLQRFDDLWAFYPNSELNEDD